MQQGPTRCRGPHHVAEVIMQLRVRIVIMLRPTGSVSTGAMPSESIGLTHTNDSAASPAPLWLVPVQMWQRVSPVRRTSHAPTSSGHALHGILRPDRAHGVPRPQGPARGRTLCLPMDVLEEEPLGPLARVPSGTVAIVLSVICQLSSVDTCMLPKPSLGHLSIYPLVRCTPSDCHVVSPCAQLCAVLRVTAAAHRRR